MTDFPSVFFAYLDPGSGSYVFQVLMAFLFAAAFTMRTYWRRFLDFLKRTFRKPPPGGITNG